jgi:voltage-gated potassium channel
MLNILTHKKIVPILVFLVLMVIFGVVIFMLLEDWTPVESLYFTVATMTTVGYGDFVPTNDVSRFVATIYMVTMVPLMLVTMGVIADAVYTHRSKRKK